MRIIKQQLSLPVTNQDLIISPNSPDKKKHKRHGALFPDYIRAVVCGPSGSGKTNALLSLLLEPNGLRYENIYIYSKSLHQPKYEYLKNVIEKVKGVGYFTFNENEHVIDPSEARRNSIFIFDDVTCEKQDKIRSYYSMGRHQDVDCFYLTQTYTKIAKHLLRDNFNIIVVFKQDDVNLRHIFSEHVCNEIAYETFKQMCLKCWEEKYGFLVIVKDDEISKGRYRLHFDKFIIPDL